MKVLTFLSIVLFFTACSSTEDSNFKKAQHDSAFNEIRDDRNPPRVKNKDVAAGIALAVTAGLIGSGEGPKKCESNCDKELKESLGKYSNNNK